MSLKKTKALRATFFGKTEKVSIQTHSNHSMAKAEHFAMPIILGQGLLWSQVEFDEFLVKQKVSMYTV